MRLKIPLLITVIGGVFLLLDQILKWQSWHSWNSAHLFWQYFGWQPYLNTGVAFGLPVPGRVTLFLTGPIILALGGWLIKKMWLNFNEKKLWEYIAGALIFFGAISNTIDRIFFDKVLDYFRIFTAMINLADAIIVIGFILFFWKFKKKSASLAGG